MTEPRRVETAADRADAVASFADAFFHDPVFSWIFEDPTVRAQYLHAWFETTIVQAADGSHVDFVDGAAAFWMPPKSASPAHPSKTDDSWVVPLLIEALGEDAAMAKLVELAKIPELHPTEPHWYLGVIGTHHDVQGKGLGSQLLREHLQICDEDNLPAYLESSNPQNVSLYLRHGWDVTGTIQLQGGPALTTMWRNAKGNE